MAPRARHRGHLTKGEFLALCSWKTPRTKGRCADNDSSLVREVTRVALSTTQEELKVGVLLVLRGVGWPTASVVLHFCDRRPYPIIDYRAPWSVGAKVPTQYSFPFWWDYTCFVRELNERSGLSMRQIDRALWQYSKERQR